MIINLFHSQYVNLNCTNHNKVLRINLLVFQVSACFENDIDIKETDELSHNGSVHDLN